MKVVGDVIVAGHNRWAEDQAVTFSNAGAARVSLATLKADRPHSLQADWRNTSDPNGETHRAQARTTVAFSRRSASRHPTGRWREKLVYDIITTDVTWQAGWRHQVWKAKGLNRTLGKLSQSAISVVSTATNRWSARAILVCSAKAPPTAAEKFTCTSSVAALGRNTVHRRGRRQQWPDGKRWHFNVGIQRRRLDVPLRKAPNVLICCRERNATSERESGFQVRMPFREANVLVTVERDGNVLHSFGLLCPAVCRDRSAGRRS